MKICSSGLIIFYSMIKWDIRFKFGVQLHTAFAYLMKNKSQDFIRIAEGARIFLSYVKFMSTVV